MKSAFNLTQEKLINYTNELSNVKLRIQEFSNDLATNITKSGEDLQSNFK